MKQGWERLKLGDFCSFQNGRAFKKNEWTNNGLPIIRIGNLNNINAPFNFYNGDYEQKIVVQNGDLLFSWSGTVGSSFGAHLWKSEKGYCLTKDNHSAYTFSLSFNEANEGKEKYKSG